MSLYFIKTPKIITSFYKNYTWQIDTQKKEIYLTFDDGPTPKVTEFVLDTLKKFDAKATFFCIGKNIKKQPKLAERIINEGHTIGNHTHNHLNGWKSSADDYVFNIERANEYIIQYSENSQRLMTNPNNYWEKTKDQKLFRPPYGKIKKSQAKKLIEKGYKVIMWSVLSGDFDLSKSKEICLKNVLKNTNNGSIVVFHDSKKAYKKLEYTLPKMLAYFSEKGFGFEKLI